MSAALEVLTGLPVVAENTERKLWRCSQCKNLLPAARFYPSMLNRPSRWCKRCAEVKVKAKRQAWLAFRGEKKKRCRGCDARRPVSQFPTKHGKCLICRLEKSEQRAARIKQAQVEKTLNPVQPSDRFRKCIRCGEMKPSLEISKQRNCIACRVEIER